jgi:hypothetical protein
MASICSLRNPPSGLSVVSSSVERVSSNDGDRNREIRGRNLHHGLGSAGQAKKRISDSRNGNAMASFHTKATQTFLVGSLQSLCLQCHVTTKAEIEHKGFATDIGADGYPPDAGHPVYRAK